MSNRNKQKQIWADELFVKKLDEIRAKSLLKGKPIKNMGILTKMMCDTESFKNLEEEILNYDPMNSNKKNNMKLKIKFDGIFQ